MSARLEKLLLRALMAKPATIAGPSSGDKAAQELARTLQDATRRVLGRALSIREVDAGSCNGCELEIHALNNPVYDLERFGLKFVASPRHADVLLVTGVLGRAAAGLRLLVDGNAPKTEAEEGWVAAQLQPVSRLAEGRRLLEAGVRCAGDISDGLLLDAARTAQACGCAAELWADSLPVDPQLQQRFGREWLQLAVGGGEDFELLAAVTESQGFAVVGRVEAGEGVVTLLAGDPYELPGWEHFR